MKARTHRGAQEIGGNCVELEADGRRLLLDLGWPLAEPPDADVPLPDVAGLAQPDPALLGVVISHPHIDHFGLLRKAAPSVPVFMGEAAHRILREAAFFTDGWAPPDAASYLRHREPLRLGPFTITPHLIDHSAFDSYCLLVEAEGRRLFYTGDVRAHGRKPGTFRALLGDPPHDVHVVVMEGTNVHRDLDGAGQWGSEADVEQACVETFRATKGLALAIYSPQNVDRLVTVCRAAIQSGRDLVLDLYGAAVTAATGRSSIPQASWDRVRVYLPNRQRARVIESGEFARADAVRPRRIYGKELVERASDLVMTFRPSMGGELSKIGCLDGAHALWLMWPGYLREPSGAKLEAFLERHSIGLSIHHTSGHAAVADLQRLARALSPARVVPIHCAAGERVHEVFEGVERHGDGEWWTV